MRREELEKLETTELVDLRSEIELLLAERNLARQPGGGREVIEERATPRGTLRRELSVDAEGSVHGPYWRLYRYEETKTGKRKSVSENLGRELPEEYQD